MLEAPSSRGAVDTSCHLWASRGKWVRPCPQDMSDNDRCSPNSRQGPVCDQHRSRQIRECPLLYSPVRWVAAQRSQVQSPGGSRSDPKPAGDGFRVADFELAHGRFWAALPNGQRQRSASSGHGKKRPRRHQAQSLRAASTTRLSLARWSVSVRGLPAAVEANPHCGPMPSWPGTIKRAAWSARGRRRSSIDSSTGVLVLTSPSTTPLPLGTKSDAEVARAAGVVLEQEVRDVAAFEEEFGHRVVAALRQIIRPRKLPRHMWMPISMSPGAPATASLIALM